MTTESPAQAQLDKIIEAARRLGVEIDEAEAISWLAAMSVRDSGGDVILDTRSGVYGHRASMLDFSPADLERYRAIGQIVGFADRPGVETALALSGSAAQSKIQTHPGDCDYFERVNIHAASREEACRILAQVMREKALEAERGDTYRLIEIKFGTAPRDVLHGERPLKRGSNLTWKPDEIRSGRIAVKRPDGTPDEITWDDASADPGWCKLDWVVADPARESLANASNMLDATWESPDGSITPLDGHLDGYFQEVYLEADSIPIFSKIVRNATPDAIDDYVTELEHEVEKYLTADINYGKAAKRMYNVFRLTGRYVDAVYVRELFNEPAAVLYQVGALIRTVDDAINPNEPITLGDATKHVDGLIVAVAGALEGPEEAEITRSLVRLRALLEAADHGEALDREIEGSRTQLMNLVNGFFQEQLEAIPTIVAYMSRFRGRSAAPSA
ncbi:MAG TPA: hypothetical protein VEW45_09455 [Candidatus Dormibacteraeota bacterium]|nr:hypothetical protein [Candidatus Dormibacteraeota bacterium]